MRFVARLLTASLITPVITLAASAEAAITKGPWVHRVSPTSAVVRFEIDPPAPAVVKLGADAAMRDGGAGTFESPETKSIHSVTLTGLAPSTRYAYEVSTTGATKLAAVTTAPKEDSTTPFKFLVYGDNRTDDAAHAAVVRGMVAVPADFLVHTGDFVENGASKPQWQMFFDIEAPLLREKPLFSCVGNHELVDGTGIEYVRYFGPSDTVGAITAPDASAKQLLAPEHINSTFRWGNARFFMLNGMVAWRSGADRAWLEKELAAADAEKGLVWRIAVVHFGPWSSGPHGNNRLLHEAGIPAMLRAHKVDLVISGHDHIYERGYAEGLAYLVSGGGGAPTYRIKSALPSARKFESVRHFIEASVSQAAINFGVLRPDGSVIERCALRKEGGWDCDAPSKTETTSSSSSPSSKSSSSSDASPSTSSRCGCRVAGDSSTRGSTAGAAALLVLGAIVVRRSRRERARRLVSVASVASIASLSACASAPPASSCPPAARDAKPAPEAIAKQSTSGTTATTATSPTTRKGPATPEAALARLFTEPRVEREWFAASFANAVPPAKVQAIVDDIGKELGAFSSAEKSADGWSLVFARGRVPAKIALDAEGHILNYSTWVEKAGKHHCVVTTWNDPARDVESGKLFAVHASLLASVR